MFSLKSFALYMFSAHVFVINSSDRQWQHEPDKDKGQQSRPDEGYGRNCKANIEEKRAIRSAMHPPKTGHAGKLVNTAQQKRGGNPLGNVWPRMRLNIQTQEHPAARQGKTDDACNGQPRWTFAHVARIARNSAASGLPGDDAPRIVAALAQFFSCGGESFRKPVIRVVQHRVQLSRGFFPHLIPQILRGVHQSDREQCANRNQCKRVARQNASPARTTATLEQRDVRLVTSRLNCRPQNYPFTGSALGGMFASAG